ncbi:MAG: Na(+)/H(+) antiporter subunit D, partial [Gammaproteobacteria bacterium]|nr:Na(+)/H(+) antiporter subunit D [Gammaproteobacteria bacterium]
NMLIAMGVAAILCILIGSQPQLLYAILPWPVEYWPYTMTHVLSQLQLLLFAALAFVWMTRQGIHPEEVPSVYLDADWVYRKLMPGIVHTVYHSSCGLCQTVAGTFHRTLNNTINTILNSRLLRFNLAASWPTGSMVFWIAIILGFFLLADALH